jgi:Tol biopolymer transport system component
MTTNAVFDGSGSWSPDGRQIVFSRAVGGMRQQLFRINVDGTGEVQLTNTPAGTNLGARWGLLRVREAGQP